MVERSVFEVAETAKAFAYLPYHLCGKLIKLL
jgi:hypothetical protein